MADSGFVIDGIRYDIPPLDSFDIDEAQIVYENAGFVVEDLLTDPDDPDSHKRFVKNLQNPGFVKALMVIAYLRANRDSTRRKAEDLIGKSNLMDALGSLFDSLKADDVGPPEVEQQPSEGPAEPTSMNGTSGESSTSDSGARDAEPLSTGTSA